MNCLVRSHPVTLSWTLSCAASIFAYLLEVG